MYLHYEDLKGFLGSISSNNPLYQSVKFDINEPVYIAGVWAYGIIDKLVTGPFQALASSADCILDLNPHLLSIRDGLLMWIENGTLALNPEENTVFDVDLYPAITLQNRSSLNISSFTTTSML